VVLGQLDLEAQALVQRGTGDGVLGVGVRELGDPAKQAASVRSAQAAGE
jgi:hypothetical protein